MRADDGDSGPTTVLFSVSHYSLFSSCTRNNAWHGWWIWIRCHNSQLKQPANPLHLCLNSTMAEDDGRDSLSTRAGSILVRPVQNSPEFRFGHAIMWMHEIPCNWRTKLFLFCSGGLFVYDALVLAHVDRQRGDSVVQLFFGGNREVRNRRMFDVWWHKKIVVK